MFFHYFAICFIFTLYTCRRSRVFTSYSLSILPKHVWFCFSLHQCVFMTGVYGSLNTCMCHDINAHTCRTVSLWHNEDFRLQLAGVSTEETLVLVVFVVRAAHWGIVIVALQRKEKNQDENKQRKSWPLQHYIQLRYEEVFFTPGE